MPDTPDLFAEPEPEPQPPPERPTDPVTLATEVLRWLDAHPLQSMPVIARAIDRPQHLVERTMHGLWEAGEIKRAVGVYYDERVDGRRVRRACWSVAK